MASNIKYYLGSLDITVGEYVNRVRLLVVANSDEQASAQLYKAAASYYGSGNEPLEDSGYYANGGELHTRPIGLKEIGAATFFELKSELFVSRAENVQVGELDAATPEGFKALAKATVHALAARDIVVPQSKMLEALASGMGQKNWQVLNAKFQAPAVKPVELSDHEGRDENKYALRMLFNALENSTAKVQFRDRTWTVDSCTPAMLDMQDGAYETVLRINLDVSKDHELAGASYGFSGYSFANVVVEDFTTVVLEDGTRVVFELPEQEWSANVCRIGYGFADISVRARTAAEAEALAEDEAGNHSYNEKSSDYEVDWVTPVK